MDKIESIDDVVGGMFLKVQQNNGIMSERIACSGLVTLVAGDIIEIKTPHGTFGLPYNDPEFDADFFILNKKPNGWDKVMDGGTGEQVTPAPASNAPAFKTKRDIVFDIVKNNPRKKVQGLLSEVKLTVKGNDDLLKQYINIAIVKFRN